MTASEREDILGTKTTNFYIFKEYVFGVGKISTDEAKEYKKVELQDAKDRVFGVSIPQTTEQIERQKEEDNKYYLNIVEKAVFNAYNKYFAMINATSKRIEKIENDIDKNNSICECRILGMRLKEEKEQKDRIQDQVDRIMRECLDSKVYTLNDLYILERVILRGWQSKQKDENFEKWINEWMEPIIQDRLSVKRYTFECDDLHEMYGKIAYEKDFDKSFDKEIYELSNRAENYFYELSFTERCIKKGVNGQSEKIKRKEIRDKLYFIADEIERITNEKKEYGDKLLKLEISLFFDECFKYLSRYLQYEWAKNEMAKEIKNKQREILKQIANECMAKVESRNEKNI